MSKSKKSDVIKANKKCCVAECTIKAKEKRIYHCFPRCSKIKQHWIIVCKLEKNGKSQWKSGMTVCSVHFQPNDYLTGPDSKKEILKPTAIPSLNLPTDFPLKLASEKVPAEQSESINTGENEENVTTIIYVPSKNGSTIITKRLDDFNIDINKQNNSTITEENFEDIQYQSDMNVDQNNANNIQYQINNIQIPNVANVKTCSDNNILKKQENDKIMRKKEKSFNITVQKTSKKKILQVSAITLCAECGQYCKIEDEDLIDVGSKNQGTLAAEILLELQEVNPTCEDERILLTKKGIEICDKALQNSNIDLMELITNDNELMAFTGINFELLTKLTRIVSLHEGACVEKYSIPVKNRIVICLCRLRTNLPFRCIAVLFGVPESVIANDFFKTLKSLSILLDQVIYWPNTEELLKNLPKCFQSFKQTRVILNCSEIEIEKQRCLKCTLNHISNNSGREIVKLVLGVAPSGLIIFKSKAFKDEAKNTSIFTQTNIMEQLDPEREAIMSDKSLNIESDCAERNITLIKPPKLEKNQYYSKNDVELIKNISAARIHVDRTLQRFKMFKILQTKVSWRIVPYVNDVCTIIAGIVNLRNPIPPDEACLKLAGLIYKTFS